MRTKPIHCVLSFLALLGTVHGSISPVAECTAQAWVRAPDLAPDTIVRGDARVKISPGCPAVETVLLGLRLKERSFVKALRSQEDRNWMQRTSPWASLPSRFANRSDEIIFHEMFANKDLWVVREEERLVFETAQVIHVAEGASRGRDVVQDFAVLVPSTNLPPALNHLHSVLYVIANAIEVVNVEFMYEYFIRVPFANGTTEEISAGITGFQPLYDPADTPQRSSPETIGLKGMGVSGQDSPITNYTAQASGLVFTQGSEDQVVTVVITRTGPARTFTAPLTIRGCLESTLSSRWAVEYNMPSSEPVRRPRHILRSTLEDVEDANRSRWRAPCFGGSDATISIAMPNSTLDEIQSHGIVTTTSAAVTIPIRVGRLQITNFETYYQTLANSLSIVLETPRTDDEGVDPDDPSAEPPSTWGPEFEDDEEPWVPWVKEQTIKMPRPRSWGRYSGNFPVVVHPIGEPMAPRRCLHAGAEMSGQVVLSGETGCEQHSLTHYLDEDARGPTFVNRSAIHELLDEDPAERGLRAPILEPVVSSAPEGEGLIHRYYGFPHKQFIYVGETWVKKVANNEQ